MSDYSDYVLVPRALLYHPCQDGLDVSDLYDQLADESEEPIPAEPLTYQQVKAMVLDELIEKARGIGATIHSPEFIKTNRATGEDELYSADLGAWLEQQKSEA